MNNWTWEEGSVLYSDSPYIAPKDIFQAVCNELGRYYTQKGAKYTKSNRRLKWQGEKLRCEMGLWSSHSNIPGKYVNLEIVTSSYAIDARDMERKGILNFSVKPKNFNVYQIDYELFEEIIQFIDDTLVTIWTYETKEGIDDFYAQKNEKELEFINGNPNNKIYYNRL